MYLAVVSNVNTSNPFKRSMSCKHNCSIQTSCAQLQVLGDATAFLTLVTGVVMYVMDVHGVATNFLHLADVCLVCLQDCLMLLGLLVLTFETVLPLTVKVMFMPVQSCKYDAETVAACAHGWRFRR